MLRAELRALHSPDLPDLAREVPEDPAHFGLLVEASIGPSGSLGEDLFNFVVCTPSWLARQVASGEYRFLRHYLLVQRYDYHLIQAALEKLCASISGPDWTSVAEKLARYGRWEFEDYQE